MRRIALVVGMSVALSGCCHDRAKYPAPIYITILPTPVVVDQSEHPASEQPLITDRPPRVASLALSLRQLTSYCKKVRDKLCEYRIVALNERLWSNQAPQSASKQHLDKLANELERATKENPSLDAIKDEVVDKVWGVVTHLAGISEPVVKLMLSMFISRDQGSTSENYMEQEFRKSADQLAQDEVALNTVIRGLEEMEKYATSATGQSHVQGSLRIAKANLAIVKMATERLKDEGSGSPSPASPPATSSRSSPPSGAGGSSERHNGDGHPGPFPGPASGAPSAPAESVPNAPPAPPPAEHLPPQPPVPVPRSAGDSMHGPTGGGLGGGQAGPDNPGHGNVAALRENLGNLGTTHLNSCVVDPNALRSWSVCFVDSKGRPVEIKLAPNSSTLSPKDGDETVRSTGP